MQQLSRSLWEQYCVTHHGFNLSILPPEIKQTGHPHHLSAPVSDRAAAAHSRNISTSSKAARLSAPATMMMETAITILRSTWRPAPSGCWRYLARDAETVATIVASTEVTVLRISSAIVYQYLMTHPDILIRCTFVVAHDLYQRSANDGLLYYLEGIDRVRYYLVQYYMLHASGQEMLAITEDYQTISSNIGVSSRTVGRSIQKLKEYGEITSIRKKIYLTYNQFQAMTSHVNKILHSGI